MICTCTHCQARYQLEADKVPQRIIKVRCPACSGVFSLDGTQREEPAAATEFGSSFETSASPFSAPQEPQVSASVPEESVVQADPFAVTEPAPAGDSVPEPGAVSFDESPTPFAASTPEDPVSAAPQTEYDIPADEELTGSVEPAAPSAPEPAAEVDSSPAAATVATLGDAPKASTRRRRCKEEMLARALVSDILVYNRDTRDTALAEGNLLEALGGEIKKSWELYKEKVTPEVANSTTYFREALNEILAEGDSVF